MSDSGSDDHGLDTSNPAIPSSGKQLGEISHALVRLYKEHYGKGPTEARTYMAGDLVVCLLGGGFLQGEKTLRDAGRGAAVSGNREALQEVLRERFIDTIEDITERKVVTFISGVDVQTETNAELFVLEPLELETGDEHQAIGAWAEQTRRQSRSLRGEQSALLAEQGRLREEGAHGRRESPGGIRSAPCPGRKGDSGESPTGSPPEPPHRYPDAGSFSRQP